MTGVIFPHSHPISNTTVINRDNIVMYKKYECTPHQANDVHKAAILATSDNDFGYYITFGMKHKGSNIDILFWTKESRDSAFDKFSEAISYLYGEPAQITKIIDPND